jgi:hypothetical protein
LPAINFFAVFAVFVVQILLKQGLRRKGAYPFHPFFSSSNDIHQAGSGVKKAACPTYRYRAMRITLEDALNYSTNPEEFKLRLQCIYTTKDAAIESMEKELLR